MLHLGGPVCFSYVAVRPALPGLSEQRQTLLDTVRAFTLDGAYTEFAEGRKGKLAEGYLADVIVLNGNIETTPPHEIAELKPVEGRAC